MIDTLEQKKQENQTIPQSPFMISEDLSSISNTMKKNSETNSNAPVSILKKSISSVSKKLRFGEK